VPVWLRASSHSKKGALTVPSELISVGPFHQFKADAAQSTYSCAELMLVVKGRKWHNKEGRVVRSDMMKGRNTKKEGTPVVGVMAGNGVDVLQHQPISSCDLQAPPAEGGSRQHPGTTKFLHARLGSSTKSERVQPKLLANFGPSIPAL
jgi:hypothetical protein